MVWQVTLCAVLVLVESGDWSAILRAQQLFHEVYGKRIEAAKTSADKSALAREILDLAKKESDSTAKMVELEQAKRLAVEANDAGLAVQVVRELARLPRNDLPDDLLRHAESLWVKAQDLTERLDAIEFYLRSNPPPLAQKLWEDRIADLIAYSVIELPAKEARLIGDTRMAYWADLEAILYWNNPLSQIEWHANVPPGEYQVSIEYAADPPMAAASLFEVALFRNERARLPLATVRFTLSTTGPWATFVLRQVGTLRISADGANVVKLRVVRKHPPEPLEQGLIAPRRIIFRRIR